ncbi:hypothetical protein FRC06_006733 [Ceratobasidium sp. 370]|nr:hypothetical protein FRC06_006733 [Ceratobasidium sp. 370]
MAQTTTSTTVHHIIKYSSSKASLPAQVGSGEIQWKHHTGEQLRLTLDIATTRDPTGGRLGGQSRARYVIKVSYLSDEPSETQHESQNTVPEVVLEKLDLSSFSEVRYHGRELPLKAVYKNSTVAFRYLHPQVQSSTSAQTYRRFQMTFKSEAEAADFIQSIQLICPCDKSRSHQPAATQATSSSSPVVPSVSQRQVPVSQTQRPVASKGQPMFSQSPNPSTVYRKSAMFIDPLSSSSLGDRSSSPVGDSPSSQGSLYVTPSHRPLVPVSFTGGQTTEAARNPTRGTPAGRMDVDNPSVSQRHAPAASDGNPRSSLPNSAQSPLSSQPVQAPADVLTGGNTAGSSWHTAVPVVQQGQSDADDITLATGDRSARQAGSGSVLSALRGGDTDLYNLSFNELRQMVAEVIREPGFPELVSAHIDFLGKS